MKKKNTIEDTLASLDNIERAVPQSFFYTRLLARLNKTHQNFWERFSGFITQPVIAFSGILLIIIINILAAYLNLSMPVTPDLSEAAMADEYTQLATNFYDLENIKP